jgi:hypothetical protein
MVVGARDAHHTMQCFWQGTTKPGECFACARVALLNDVVGVLCNA